MRGRLGRSSNAPGAAASPFRASRTDATAFSSRLFWTRRLRRSFSIAVSLALASNPSASRTSAAAGSRASGHCAGASASGGMSTRRDEAHALGSSDERKAERRSDDPTRADGWCGGSDTATRAERRAGRERREAGGSSDEKNVVSCASNAPARLATREDGSREARPRASSGSSTVGPSRGKLDVSAEDL